MQQQHKNGRTLNITSAVSMVKNPQGKAVGSVLVNRDSSQQAEVDKYMRISAYLFDVATDSIFVHDLDGYIIFFNEAAYKSRGYTYDEMTKMNIKDLDSPEYRVKFDFAIKHLLEKNIETFEGAHLRKDGSVMPIEIRARIIEIDNQKLILSVVRDITERKKSEAELEESKEEYRSLFVNMIDGFAYCKIVRNQDAEPVDIEYLEVNDTFEKILDLKKENVIGKKITEIIPDVNKIHPELIEMYGIVADTGKGQKFEIFFKPLNRWLFVSLYCPRKEYVVSIFEDITDRKLNEAQLQADKQEIENVSEKLRVIGRLTRHDVQNKLAIVEGNSYLLKKEVFDNTKAIQYLNGITIALEDIKKILEVSNLYEKVGVEKLSDINVTQAFNEAVSNSSNLKEIQVINNCSNLYVKADSMLRQLFYNLIDNSIEHGKKVTQIKFSCKEEKDQIYLIYEDNGIDIPAANNVQLFKERFTTAN
jgi:PAS domain S-box-containing protein